MKNHFRRRGGRGGVDDMAVSSEGVLFILLIESLNCELRGEQPYCLQRGDDEQA
jgi:hypothetical protein